MQTDRFATPADMPAKGVRRLDRSMNMAMMISRGDRGEHPEWAGRGGSQPRVRRR